MIWELNGNMINWPGVCHVNGPSWFSGGTALTQFGQCIHVFVLYNTCLGNAQNGIANCTIRLCVLWNMSLCIVQMSCTVFALVSHAGQWPICQRERAIDRIFAPRSLSKWELQKMPPTLVICQNTSPVPHFLFGPLEAQHIFSSGPGDWVTHSLTDVYCRI